MYNVASMPPANTSVESNKLDDLSSANYVACCGLDHLLARMANAHAVAKKLGFSLR